MSKQPFLERFFFWGEICPCRSGQEYKSYLGPRSSAGHSLRFLDSALAGSDEFSPTPLILNAYQRLEDKRSHRYGFTDGTTHKTLDGLITNSENQMK